MVRNDKRCKTCKMKGECLQWYDRRLARCAYHKNTKVFCGGCPLSATCVKIYKQNAPCMVPVTSEKKYCVTLKTLEQVTPDDYEIVYKNLECVGNTRVLEIIDWVKSVSSNRILSLQLTEMDEIK